MNRLLGVLLLLGLAANAAPGQVSPGTPVPHTSSNFRLTDVVVLAELTKTLDVRKAHPGDAVVARVTQDVRVDDRVIAKGSRLVGQVEHVHLLAKREADSTLTVAFGKMISKDGSEVRLPALLQAIGAGISADSTDDPPDPSSQVSDRSGCVPGMDSLRSAMGQANSGGGSRPRRLTSTSTGVVGLTDLALAAQASNESVLSVITSGKRNVKLESGTQLVLRVLGP